MPSTPIRTKMIITMAIMAESDSDVNLNGATMGIEWLKQKTCLTRSEEEEVQMDIVHNQMKTDVHEKRGEMLLHHEEQKGVAKRQDSTLEISESKAERLQHLHNVEEDLYTGELVGRRLGPACGARHGQSRCVR